MKFLGAFAICLLPVGVAHAGSIPRYDPPAYCKTVADSVGGSAMILNGCIQQEQDAYNSLKADWAGILSKTQSYCDEVADSVGGTYQILKGCIDQELDAAGSTPEFEF